MEHYLIYSILVYFLGQKFNFLKRKQKLSGLFVSIMNAIQTHLFSYINNSGECIINYGVDAKMRIVLFCTNSVFPDITGYLRVDTSLRVGYILQSLYCI